jgi:hypothetical protein
VPDAAWAGVVVVRDPAARAAATTMTAAIGLDAGRLEVSMGKRKTDMEVGILPGAQAVPPVGPRRSAFWRSVCARSIAN